MPCVKGVKYFTIKEECWSSGIKNNRMYNMFQIYFPAYGNSRYNDNIIFWKEVFTMLRRIEDYISVAGHEVIADLHRKAKKLYHKHVIHFNSTFLGGGVAEILSRFIPLMNDVGVESGWRVLHGNASFYELTKKFHNGLQSADITFTEEEKKLYYDVNQGFSSYTHIDHDCVVVHDPQPLPIILNFSKQQPWIWRCHIDISNPNEKLWEYLKAFLLRYDVIIISSKDYRKKDLPVDQRVIPPAIDPLSLKNRELSEKEIAEYIKHAEIPTDKPIITQVSRMDLWKDPEGVLEIYKRVREKVDCRLLYCYNLATDDPEGMEIYTRLYEKAKEYVKNNDVIFVMGNNETLVNAIQTFSDVIIQKSIKEGFCLAVTEALWKATPVVASRVGGIPQQIHDKKTGFLLDPYDIDGFADVIIKLLKDKKYANEIGKAGKEFVRKNFLLTRLMSNYLDLIHELM
jgi:trehalose synthase